MAALLRRDGLFNSSKITSFSKLEHFVGTMRLYLEFKFWRISLPQVLRTKLGEGGGEPKI